MKQSPRTHYALNSSGIRIRKTDLDQLLVEDWLVAEAGNRGYLYSETVLKHYLDLEYRLGEHTLTPATDSLLSKSTGERKKLLLNHLLAQKPDFLILDHPFDGLDKETVAVFREQFLDLAHKTTLIQIYTRSEDLLLCCTEALHLENGRFKKAGTVSQTATAAPLGKAQTIPKALVEHGELPDVLIAFKEVSVSFGDKQVLQAINWEIQKGECWQLTGLNGSGKTTLLSMITGDSVKGYGKELYIFGSKKGSGESVWEIKKKIGYITPVLTERFDGMHTVSDMIVGGLYDSVGLYKRPTSLERKIAADWTTLLGLEAQATTRFRDLAEVDKRLVLIARAMIKNPPLLILDEPTNALGDREAALVISLVNRLSTHTPTAIIFVSHRNEPGLLIDREFHLKKTATGSKGTVI